MAKKEKNRWVGIFIGPLLVLFAITALWKNETRFDYHKAAAATPVVTSATEGEPGESFCFTGPMDQQLTFAGGYVESFTGYLTVNRSAEIYAWDRDKDDDDVKWTLRWMSSVESNSRNSGLHQALSSKQFFPPEYAVGDLIVEPNKIEFVDSGVTIGPKNLTLTPAGKSHQLQPNGEYFYLYNNQPQNLGDERVRYVGVPVPATATYFGRYEVGQGEVERGATGRGIADDSHARAGFINGLIQDTGILHHIVAGDRSQALATMKGHIQRLKWIIRGIGTACVVLGFFLFFATVLGFLFHIPVIGRIAETGSFVLALAIGLPVAFITIVGSYLVAHPLLLIAILVLTFGAIYVLRKRGAASQVALKRELDHKYGHQVGVAELKELEFVEMAQLAQSDGSLGANEERYLRQWSRKHRWDREKYDQMLQRAKSTHQAESGKQTSDAHLKNLIQLAMADGNLSAYELRSIRHASKRAGYDDKTIRQLINHARRSVN